MASTLQLVDSTDLSTVLFDFNSTTGSGNPNGVITKFGAEGSFMFSAPPEMVTVSPPASAGGRVVYRRDPLGLVVWRNYIDATSADNLVGAVGELSRLLAAGGVLKWIPHGSSETRYIEFEPSVTPILYGGEALGLWHILQRFSQAEPITFSLTCQPYMKGAELTASTNKVLNGLMVHDFDASNRPDSWPWTGTTGLSNESISTDAVNWGYKFTKADGAQAFMTQTTAVGSFAPGDVVTFSFYAKVDAVAGGPKMYATVQLMQSDGTTVVSTSNGTLTALTTSWQRISVTTGTAGALTSRALLYIQVDNDDATSVVMRVRMAQAEIASSASAFRQGVESIAYDPAANGTVDNPRVMVYGQGNAPSLAKVTITSDSNGISRARLYREMLKPVDVLKATLFKQLESGTLGSDTTSQADANASGGNYARVLYTTPSPSLRADNSAGGTGATISVTKPSGTAAGDVLVAFVWRAEQLTSIAAPEGWKTLGLQQQSAATFGGLTSVLFAFYKVADATDALSSTTAYTFTVVSSPHTTTSYRAWVGAFQNVDNSQPIDVFSLSTENNNATPTAPTITTSRNNNMVITAYFGNGSAGSLNFTTPAGSTPTYTEQDDGTTNVTTSGGAVYTGVLATAGTTGTKDSTAAFAIDACTLNMALNIAPPALAARSTVTFSSLPAGTYDLWLRYQPDAASYHRIRAEWAPVASPSIYNALEDFLCDVRTATAFAYADHLFGRLEVPADFTTPTVTVRVSSGIETGTAQNLRLDCVYLKKADDHVGQVTSPTLLTTGEFLVSDAEADRAYHLDTSSQTKEVAESSGPMPIELQPGLNLIDPVLLKDAAGGFVDRASTLGAVHTIAVNHKPRYRT